MNNEELTMCFSTAGGRYGFDDVKAEFSAFRDFKVKWTRNYKRAEFQVSDYLWDAPPEVLVSLAGTIFAKIRGEDADYDERVCAWLTSEEFLRSKQPTYLRRYPGFRTATAGEAKNLAESVRRLEEAGLVSAEPHEVVGWIRPSRGRSVGHASVLMKVVGISGMLDSGEVDDRLLDYCVYSQMVHVSLGFSPQGRCRGPEYDARMSRFPGRSAMESELRRLNLHI